MEQLDLTTLGGRLGTDFVPTLLLLAFVVIVGAAYSIRVLIKGRARYDRVDKQGGSPLLPIEVMHGVYWFLQPLGRILVFFRVTPNAISWTSLFFGALAGGCLAAGHFGSAACFGTVSALCDALDGMVARLARVASGGGEILDAAIDRYVEFFMLGGLILYYREIPVLMTLAMLALIGSFMVSYSTAKAEAANVTPPKGSMRRPERALYLIMGCALAPVTIPWFERVREFPIPIAHPVVVALGLIGVISNVSAVERLWTISRQMRVREAAVAEAREHDHETSSRPV